MNMKKHIIGCLFLSLLVAVPMAPLLAGQDDTDKEDEEIALVDDWVLDQSMPNPVESTALHGIQAAPDAGVHGRVSGNIRLQSYSMLRGSAGIVSLPAAKLNTGTLGLAVGGAKDTDNFTQNLASGFLPKYDSITYEGTFYNHYFETGIGSGACDSLFCPSFARGVATDLYSGETDYYLGIGLNSGMTAADFKRKPLNLVVVLDISGSMGSRLDTYAYDPKQAADPEDARKTKIELADRAIVDMMAHLHGHDRFSVVLFDDSAHLAKPFRLVATTDMQAIGKHILAIRDHGGTNWEAGYAEGLHQFNDLPEEVKNPADYENRIIFLTDAMPNTGRLDKNSLLGMIRDAADQGIYTTILGIGLDFNADLAEYVSKVRGANYYTIQSPTEFKKRLADEFDFMVTPLVFDLAMRLAGSDFAIEGVYGSPEANLATGTLMRINTLFPSSSEEERVKGGVVLVKLKNKTGKTGPVHLVLTYHDRSGREFHVKKTVTFPDSGEKGKELFDNSGIRKAILLGEYVSLVKNWLVDGRKGCNDQVKDNQPRPMPKTGFLNPEQRPERRQVATWERKSCLLAVSPGYRKFFTLFAGHFRKEMQALNDKSLEQELKVLAQLVSLEEKPAKTRGAVDDWILGKPQIK